MKQKLGDLEMLNIRKSQSFMFVKPKPPSIFKRLGMRIIPQYEKRYCKKIIAASGFFDRDWYLERYPDIGLSGVDPLWHFVSWGNNDKRDPGPNFSTLIYLESYPDTAQSSIPALAHYILHGRNEGRIAQPSNLGGA